MVDVGGRGEARRPDPTVALRLVFAVRYGTPAAAAISRRTCHAAAGRSSRLETKTDRVDAPTSFRCCCCCCCSSCDYANGNQPASLTANCARWPKEENQVDAWLLAVLLDAELCGYRETQGRFVATIERGTHCILESVFTERQRITLAMFMRDIVFCF
jgi:hypothetical protein